MYKIYFYAHFIKKTDNQIDYLFQNEAPKQLKNVALKWIQSGFLHFCR
jgi:hypothetical protein